MTERHPLTKMPVVLRVEGMEQVVVHKDVPYRTTEQGPLTADIYVPAGRVASTPLVPVVIFVTGYSDAGMSMMLGCNSKEMAMYESWGRLLAARGIAAVTYVNRDPAADAEAVLAFVRANVGRFGLDAGKLGIWSASGNVPVALSLIMSAGRDAIRCAVLSCGFTIDLNGATHVADAQQKWRFANPSAGKTPADLPNDCSLLLLRAGKDENPGLNASLDVFIAGALAAGLPLSLVNHPAGPHSFEIFDPSARSKAIVAQTLNFFETNLSA